MKIEVPSSKNSKNTETWITEKNFRRKKCRPISIYMWFYAPALINEDDIAYDLVNIET